MVDPLDGISSCISEFYVIPPTVISDNPLLTIHIWGVDVSIDIYTVNKVLRVTNVSTTEFMSRIPIMDMK